MIERHCGKCERLEQKRCNLKERIVLLEAMLEGFFDPRYLFKVSGDTAIKIFTINRA